VFTYQKSFFLFRRDLIVLETNGNVGFLKSGKLESFRGLGILVLLLRAIAELVLCLLEFAGVSKVLIVLI
jgi:hypothetical protein